tara:strand:+ start:382 stop:672 length:291 start_codon:yes stop_codon:yes gene_type:complete
MFQKQIDNFIKPLREIIRLMLNKCTYINDESLERHQWNNVNKKYEDIPNWNKEIKDEQDILPLIKNKSINEVLWGDVQLGKREHACIIMWFSINQV